MQWQFFRKIDLFLPLALDSYLKMDTSMLLPVFVPYHHPSRLQNFLNCLYASYKLKQTIKNEDGYGAFGEGPEVTLYFCLVKPISIRINEITLEVFKLEVAYDPRFAIMCLIYEHKFERCTFCLKLFVLQYFLFIFNICNTIEEYILIIENQYLISTSSFTKRTKIMRLC